MIYVCMEYNAGIKKNEAAPSVLSRNKIFMLTENAEQKK